MNVLGQVARQIKRVGLSKDKRHYLLSVIKNYIASNQAIYSIFDHLHREDTNQAIREIAIISKASIREREPFASDWHRSGYFSLAEQRLLVVGEQYECLPQVCDFFTTEDGVKPSSVVGTLGENAEWVIMIFFVGIVAVYGLGYEKHFGDANAFFTIGHFLVDFGAWFAIFIATLACFYAWSVKNLTGSARRVLRYAGLYRLHDSFLELRVLKICSALAGSKMPATAIVESLIEAFGDEVSLLKRLKKARGRLSEVRLPEALPEFITPVSLLHINSKAPDGTPGQLSDGFDLAARMLSVEITRTQAIVAMAWRIFFACLALGLTIPLVSVVMGAGLG